MKYQWNLILAFIFALIVAVFAVINVDPVSVKYVFGEAQWPLILVILGSVLMGGLIVGFFGIVRIYILQRKVKSLTKENDRLAETITNLESKEAEVTKELDEKTRAITGTNEVMEEMGEEEKKNPPTTEG